MKFYFLAITVLVSLSKGYGQSSPRQFYNINNAWTDLNISGKIKGKFLYTVENQQRRQDMQGEYNDATTTGNPYHNLNQHVFRPYVHYQVNPNLRLSLMPLGWIGSNRFKDGAPSAFFSELRIAPQVIITQYTGRIKFDNRLRYELRWLGKNQATTDKSFLYGGDFSTTTFKERFRYQFKATIPLNHKQVVDKTLYFQAYNELFVNFGKNVPNINLLDQNRILVGFGYRFNKFISVEAGFMRQSIYRLNNATTNNVDRNNVFQTNLAINNFENLFKAKK